MVIKRIRASLLALAAVFVLGTALSMPVAAVAASPPAGFEGSEIKSVDLEVDSGFAWYAMTEDEYGLTYDANVPVYIAGNSGKEADGTAKQAVSNLAITVTEPGALTFEYAIDAYYNVKYPLYAANSYLGYRINGAITTDMAYNSSDCSCIAHGESLPGAGNWSTFTINVDSSAFENADTATIYVAYQHIEYYGESDETDLNYAAIRNVTYSTGSRSAVGDFDAAMGSVTADLVGGYTDADYNYHKTYTPVGLDELAVGSAYRLTAKAKSGYEFYGWFRHYLYEDQWYTAFEPSENGAMEIVVSDTAYYVPTFATADSYIARNGTTFYTAEDGLKKALDEAANYSTVALLGDYTLSEDLTVRENITLYVPFRDSWGEEENSGRYFYSSTNASEHSTSIQGADKAYAILTVPSGVTLTVNGNLAVGSYNGYPSQRFQGHVSGPHGRIQNDGTITVNSGGKFTCLGITEGSGLVYVNDGGVLKESMIICDFAGGNNSADLYFDNQMPFKRFALQNVQCTLKMEARSSLVCLGNVYALSDFNYLDVELFGDSDGAAFRPNTVTADTIALTRTYDGSMSLTDNSTLLDVNGIGRTNWTFSGGMTFQPFTIDAGIVLSTENSDLPIPYNFNIRLTSGTYNIPSGMRIMPGAEVTVDSSAIVKLGGRLLVMDGLVQTDMSGDRYPTKAELEAAGFKSYGVANLNGKLIMAAGSTLGGVINSSGGGTLVLQEGVNLINGSENLLNLDPAVEDLKDQSLLAEDTYASVREDGYYTGLNNWVQQDGSKGTYDENTVWFNLPAKLYDGKTLITPEAGKTYVSTAITAVSVSDEYEGRYVPDGEYNSDGYTSQGTAGVRDMSDGSYTFTRTVNATWADGTAKIDVTVVTENVPGYDNESSPAYGAEIIVDSQALSDGQTQITITTDNTSAVFVHLVKCQYADGTEVIIANADDKHRDGVFMIPADAVSATVESGLLGDVSKNGLFDMKDVGFIRKSYLGTETLDQLALLLGDISENGSIDMKDVGFSRKTYLGTYTIC